LLLGERSGRNNSDFFFSVELGVELLVSLGDFLDVHKLFVFLEHLNESNSDWLNSSDLNESVSELSNLSRSNTSVLSEELERLGVLVQKLNISHVFVNFEKSVLSGGAAEKNTSISSFNGVLNGWWQVVWGRLNNLNVTNSEWLEQVLGEIWGLNGGRGSMGGGVSRNSFVNNFLNNFLLLLRDLTLGGGTCITLLLSLSSLLGGEVSLQKICQINYMLILRFV
jgi:hypothetical protein